MTTVTTVAQAQSAAATVDGLKVTYRGASLDVDLSLAKPPPP